MPLAQKEIIAIVKISFTKNKMNRSFLLVCCIVFTLPVFSQNIKVDEILLENRKNPIGIDITQPRFTWILTSDKRNVVQTAYEIQVGTDEQFLKKGTDLIWKSGRSIQINRSISFMTGLLWTPLKNTTGKLGFGGTRTNLLLGVKSASGRWDY